VNDLVLKDTNSCVATTYSLLLVLHIWMQELTVILFYRKMLHNQC